MKPRTCTLSDLPEDMQILISDFIEEASGQHGLTAAGNHHFQLLTLPVAAFPEVEMWTDYRDRAYSEAMIGKKLPPVIVCGRNWLDGRNRVWAARKTGRFTVDAIDLAELGLSLVEGLGILNCFSKVQRDFPRCKTSHPLRLRDRDISRGHVISLAESAP